MIDPTLRNERVAYDAADPTTAVLLIVTGGASRRRYVEAGQTFWAGRSWRAGEVT